MAENPNPIEQETERLICKGEDLLDRTHEVAREILRRVRLTMQGDSRRPVPPARKPVESGT